MRLFKTQSCASKLIVRMCTYGYYSICNQVLDLAFTPSWSKDITDPACLSLTSAPTYFPPP